MKQKNKSIERKYILDHHKTEKNDALRMEKAGRKTKR